MDLTQERVLVTGAAGLVGRCTVARLRELGVRVRAHEHAQPGSCWVCGPTEEDPFERMSGDLRHKVDCAAAVKGQSVVIMLAASTSGAGVTASDPMAHVTPNIEMNLNMLEAADKAGVQKFLYLSSTTGYAYDHQHPQAPVVEEDYETGSPHPAYFFMGHAKRFSEHLCEMYSKLGMPTVVLRPTNIYGPWDKFDPRTSHVLAALIRKVMDGQNPIEVWGNGNEYRDLVFVEDMVTAIILALEKVEDFDVFNIGSGTVLSVNEMLQAILKQAGREDAGIRYDPTRLSTIPYRAVFLDKARTVLGYVPSVTFEDGLTQTMDWYEQNRSTICR